MGTTYYCVDCGTSDHNHDFSCKGVRRGSLTFKKLSSIQTPQVTIGSGAVQWQILDRFRGSGSGRVGTITSVTAGRIGFEMDDSPGHPGECDRSLFERHAVRLEDGSPPPTLRSVHTGPVTCRGCSTVNEYAESDRGDSSYLCGSCRIWK